MRNTKIIALAGKGGVGKTSISAAIVRLLSEIRPDKRILVIDCGSCALKSICDEVEGMKELHFGKESHTTE